ncbi:MAG: hypothetical protein EBR82_82340 [Caulobacteraceae bacterium]|nr:hypothetical protein [Caulobacteraceae bacterium]
MTGPTGVLEYYSQPAAPSPLRPGALWLDEDNGRVFLRYGSQWIEFGVQGERGATGAVGATGSTGPSVTGPQGNFSTLQSVVQRSTSDWLLATDVGKLVAMNGSDQQTLLIDTAQNRQYPVGSHIDIARMTSGPVYITGVTGVTVNATPGTLLRAQYSAATAIHYAENYWLIVGDLSK